MSVSDFIFYICMQHMEVLLQRFEFIKVFTGNATVLLEKSVLLITIQSNLYITALYNAVTLCTTVTEQLPKNHPLYLLLTCIFWSPLYSGRGHPLDSLNPQFYCLFTCI